LSKLVAGATHRERECQNTINIGAFAAAFTKKPLDDQWALTHVL
jgi:hypothetical protein